MNLKLETQACHLPETHDFLASLQLYWNWNQRKQLTHLFTLSALTRSLAHPLDHLFRNEKATMVFINLNPALFSNLNITRITSIHVPDGIHCRLACLKTTLCFRITWLYFPVWMQSSSVSCFHTTNITTLDKLIYSPIYNHFSVPVRSNVFVLAVFDKDLGILRSKMERNVFRVLYLIWIETREDK